MPIEWLSLMIIAIIALVALGVLGLTWLPAMIIKRRCISELRVRCGAGGGKLALTYDDGPDPLLTPKLVELLRRYNAKATFFLVGFRALRSPAMCDLLIREGHQLGCHSHMHKRPWKVWPWQTAQDAIAGYRSMSNWIASSAPFRPPFGKLTTWSWLAAARRNAPLSFWTHDGCDTHPTLPNPAQVAQRIIGSERDNSAHHMEKGAVVLLHSHDRGKDREQYVLDVTEQLLIAAKEHRLKVCTMADLLR